MEKSVGPSALKRRERDRLRAAQKRAAMTPEERQAAAAKVAAWKRANPEKVAALRAREVQSLRERRETEPSVRESQRARSRRHADDRRTRLDAIKSVPCMDCGGRFPPVCMDFDHRDPSTKANDRTASMSTFAASQPWSVVMAEIAKCDVVCANCHRIRTSNQQRRAKP